MVSIFDNKIKEYGVKFRKERREKRLARMFTMFLRENFEANDLQREILNIEDKRYVYTTEGRRIGLTTAGNLKALKAVLENKRVLIVSQFENTARVSRLLFSDLLKPEILRNEFILRNNSLIGPNRSVIDFRSACSILRESSSPIRGCYYDLIIIDEATYLNEGEKEKLLEELEPCIAHSNGQLIMFNRIGQL